MRWLIGLLKTPAAANAKPFGGFLASRSKGKTKWNFAEYLVSHTMNVMACMKMSAFGNVVNVAGMFITAFAPMIILGTMGQL